MGWGKNAKGFLPRISCCPKSPRETLSAFTFPLPPLPLLALCREGESQNPATSAGGFQTFGPVTHSQEAVTSRGLEVCLQPSVVRTCLNMVPSPFCLIEKMLRDPALPRPTGRGPGLGGSKPAGLPQGHCPHAGPQTRLPSPAASRLGPPSTAGLPGPFTRERAVGDEEALPSLGAVVTEGEVPGWILNILHSMVSDPFNTL